MTRSTTIPLPSLERLQELFIYDDELKNLVNRITRTNAKAGAIAGSVEVSGYRRIRVDTVKYQAHRLIWLWHTGIDPLGLLVDHRDQDPTNNCFTNLRLATDAQNIINGNRKGYCFYKTSGRWIARLRTNSVSQYLGAYDTEEEARSAYLAAIREIYGEFCPD